jgi:hypothetical protein
MARQRYHDGRKWWRRAAHLMVVRKKREKERARMRKREREREREEA